MGFKTNKCCCEPAIILPPYYTMRGFDSTYFVRMWSNTNDGLPLDRPPFAQEYEIMPLDDSVVSSGLVNQVAYGVQGDIVITSRDIDGNILLQSDPSAFPLSQQTGPLYLEVGDTLIWVIKPTSLGAYVVAFDKITFETISQFTIANTNPRFTSVRAIDDDLVFVYGQSIGTITTYPVARKYDYTGTLIDSVTIADLLFYGEGTIQQVAFVSRHIRSYDKILCWHNFRAPNPSGIGLGSGVRARFSEINLSDFSIVIGPDHTNANHPGLSGNLSGDNFTPDGSKVFFVRRRQGFSVEIRTALLDLATLEYDYYITPAKIGAIQNPYINRTTNEYGISVNTELGYGTVCYELLDGSRLWGKPVGLGWIISAGYLYGFPLRILDVETGILLQDTVSEPLGFYARELGGTVFVSNGDGKIS